MKSFLSRFGRTVAFLTMLAVLLSCLSIEIFALTPLSASWGYRFNNSSSLSSISGTYTTVNSGDNFLSSNLTTTLNYLYISCTIPSDAQLAPGSMLYCSFRLDSGGASPSSIGTVPSERQLIYYGTRSGNRIDLNNSFSSSQASIRYSSSSSLSVIVYCVFPFDPNYLTYVFTTAVQALNGSGMILTTLVDPVASGTSLNEGMYSVMQDISRQVSDGVLSIQQGNAIMQSVSDAISADYVDHDEVDNVVNSASDESDAEAAVQSAADDILNQDIVIGDQTYSISAPADVFNIYEQAFSSTLQTWDNFSLSGASYFRGTLERFLQVFGIFVFFPCMLGIVGALVGRGSS